MLNFKTLVIGSAAAFVLASCGSRELILDGERLELRQAVQSSDDVEPIDTNFTLPPQVNHTSWTHRNGSPSRQIDHPALAETVSQVWSTNIGQGNAKRQRLTADPVVADGRIFTLDASSRVTAVSTEGSVIWQASLVPSSDRDRDASGGGLAYAEGTVVVSTGFGELFAIDAESGAIRWRQKLDAPVTSAPTVQDGLVYVVTRDSGAWAITLDIGRIRWRLPGTPSGAVITGGSGPAMAGRVAIFPFGSGEVVAALKNSGIRVWGSSVAGERRGRAYANISDVTGDPVVVDRVIYAANQGGRAVALKVSSGDRIWTANEGAYSPVWPADNSVFLVSDQAELVRLDRETGETIWTERLPYFTRDRLKRRSAVFTHYGPVLAGGLLRVASDDGLLRSFNPETGELVNSISIPGGGAASNPVVVDRTLYLVNTRGQLVAFR